MTVLTKQRTFTDILENEINGIITVVKDIAKYLGVTIAEEIDIVGTHKNDVGQSNEISSVSTYAEYRWLSNM